MIDPLILDPGMAHSDRSGFYINPRRVDRPVARLVTYPYAGASAVAYHGWAAQLDASIELISIQYRGRGRLSKFQPHERLDHLVQDAFLTLTSLDPLPYFFFGHSMGAAIAFEMVRLLRSTGRELPRALFVSAAAAPHIKPVRENTRFQSDEDLMARLQRYGGMRQEILDSPDMMAVLKPLFRADLIALDTWRFEPGEPIPVPIIALGGNKDSTVKPSDVEAWGCLTSHRFESHIFNGGHFYFQEHLTEVIKVVADVMNSLI